MTRVLVTGSRNWTDRRAVWDALSQTATEYGIDGLIVVHGDAIGADTFAKEWALANETEGVVNEPHPAGYTGTGSRRRWVHPLVRNQEMVDQGAHVCLAFVMPCVKASCHYSRPHPSHGTSHTMTLAEVAGIPVKPHHRRNIA